MNQKAIYLLFCIVSRNPFSSIKVLMVFSFLDKPISAGFGTKWLLELLQITTVPSILHPVERTSFLKRKETLTFDRAIRFTVMWLTLHTALKKAVKVFNDTSAFSDYDQNAY